MDSLAVQLAQLENAQLVRRAADEELSYLFKHALTQESAYESLLLKRRRRIHRLVAEAYERSYPDHLDGIASLLAHHFVESGDDEKIVEYAMRAGDHARRLSGQTEAGAHYALALQALSRLPDTAENRRVRIDAIVKQTVVSFTSASPEQNLTSLREAELLVEDLLRPDETSSVDRLRRARVHMWMGRMHFYAMERRAALENFRQVLPVAQELGDEELGALAVTLMARILLWEGEFSQALPLLQQGLAPLEQRHDWTEWIVTDSLLGLALAAGGDYHAGVAEAEQALARAQELHHLNGTSIAYGLLAVIHLMGGAIQQMLDASRASVQSGLALESWLSTYSAFGTQAWAESHLGQHQAARQSMAQAEAISQKFGGHYLIDDWFAAVKVEMAFNARQIEETLTRAEEAVAFARSIDGKFAEALVQRTWSEALLALNPPHWEEAEAHLASGLELFDSGGARLEAARTHVVWGKLWRKHGNTDAAREHFEKAAAQFQASELTSELEQTKDLIKSLST
jgi:tetratricopeptide (TPR) repeat protein